MAPMPAKCSSEKSFRRSPDLEWVVAPRAGLRMCGLPRYVAGRGRYRESNGRMRIVDFLLDKLGDADERVSQLIELLFVQPAPRCCAGAHATWRRSTGGHGLTCSALSRNRQTGL